MIDPNFVFQTDSEIINEVYNKNNFLIVYDEKCINKDTCAIYFSSNNIYYPNTEEVFRKRIIERDFYEWYHTRISKAYKHIFLRDIKKQWYITGINSQINSPELLLNFLKKEVKGFSTITVGSSAGGSAEVLYG